LARVLLELLRGANWPRSEKARYPFRVRVRVRVRLRVVFWKFFTENNVYGKYFLLPVA